MMSSQSISGGEDPPPHPPPPTKQGPSSSKHHSSVISLQHSHSNLRETLSSFGDDLVRLNKDMDFTFPIPEGISNHPEGNIKFERVSSTEVGLRSSRWKKKAIAAGIFASKQKIGDLQGTGNLNEEDEGEERSPPFWGVGQRMRGRISMLSLQLSLHEIACFASLALFGSLIVNLLKGGVFKHESVWALDRCYESAIVLFFILTSIGFLMRIDTTNAESLLTSPILFFPIILMSVCIYLTKGWALQKEECKEYSLLSEEIKKHVYLTQDCLALNDDGDSKYNPAVIIVMNAIPVILSLFVGGYLFLYRNRWYIIHKFGRH